MKNLWLVILVALFSCQNEKPYLVTETDSAEYLWGYVKPLNRIDTIYIHDTVVARLSNGDTIHYHDTIIDAVYMPKKKKKGAITEAKPHWPLQLEWKGSKVEATTEIPNEVLRGYIDNEIEIIRTDTTNNPFFLDTKPYKDTLGGGQYYVSVINTPTGKNVEVNYSIENKMLIGWDGKHYVLCGVDDWGGCEVHYYHKTLREILDSAKQK